MRHEMWSVVVGVGIVAVGGLSLHASDNSGIQESGDASIVVRTYTRPDSEPDIRTARRTASGILGRAGIRVAWVECGLPAADTPAADACRQSLRSDELIVRIVSVGTADSRPHVDSLGFAFVDPHTGGGWVATVYADRVARMAQLAGVDAVELLGRAMAHEIGHLLLGTNRHTRNGLMRASWSGADLRRDSATQWLFGRKDGEAMRRRITTGDVKARGGRPQ
jgi:hypothetical protein